MTRKSPQKLDDQHIELMQSFAKLEVRLAIIETKVDNLNTKVAIQNGRVADAEVAIKKLMSTDDINKGKSIGINNTWKIIFTILTIVIGILSYMAIIHPHS